MTKGQEMFSYRPVDCLIKSQRLLLSPLGKVAEFVCLAGLRPTKHTNLGLFYQGLSSYSQNSNN